MSLRFRALRLRALTTAGEFGRDLHFDDGLVVLRADNSMGKSTTANSLLYALGMEGLISQGHRVPLPPVMTSKLLTPDDREVPVAESRVLLEAENHEGKVLTFERYAKRQDGDTRVIRVWNAARVTAPKSDDTFADLLARVSGSGAGDLGVGPVVERFVGWRLPNVVMTDGSERRLYPELVLPLMFVEQRGGWRGIQAGMPSTYGIPDVRLRAREFVLGLEVYERERERLRLRRQRDAIRQSWTTAIERTAARLSSYGLRLVDVSSAVDSSFDDNTPIAAVDLVAGRPFVELRAELDAQLAELERTPADDVSSSPSDEEARLLELQEMLQLATLTLREDQQRRSTRATALAELDEQAETLRGDLVRNLDARRLKQLGGVNDWTTDERDCPTCHQPVPPTLLGSLDRPTMTVEQNIDFIEQQIELLSASRAETARVLELLAERQAASQRAVTNLRAEIRALQTSLVSATGTPSAAEIQRRLLLGQRRDEFGAAEVELASLRDELHSISRRARSNAAAIAGLDQPGLSSDDETRLETLEAVFVDQLRQYRPKSLPVEDLAISRESYLPASGGYDLGFDVSASDGIRLIWAYLLGLLETDRHVQTNHLGFVVFDEPRQQSASDRSLEELLRRASTSGAAGQQVVFATSEPVERLEPILAQLPCQYLPIAGRLLQPID